MGKHYSEASRRTQRGLHLGGLGVAVLALLGGVVAGGGVPWFVVAVVALVGLAIALWNRRQPGDAVAPPALPFVASASPAPRPPAAVPPAEPVKRPVSS
ncbi:MAG: hypothetical protein LCH98_05100 [Actinobacteria bacterium]|nr:hypothetical protein [Actinomycetota bacterium]